MVQVRKYTAQTTGVVEPGCVDGVAANRELINRFEQKIQITLARIWGDNEAVSVDVAEHATSEDQTEAES